VRNLYKSLLTYKAKEGREPLEEFTSGALADLLSRMDADTLSDFLSLFRDWRGNPVTPPDEVAREDFEWDAEHSVWSSDASWGRADIIGLAGNKPAIIIENKIAAAVSDSQISLYREALEGAGTSAPLLLFLTSVTEPPTDFREPQSSKVTHGAARWSQVYGFLNSRGCSTQSATAFQALSCEFAQFLKFKELHMDMMSPKDSAVLQLWLNSRQRVDTTANAMLSSMAALLSPWRKGSATKLWKSEEEDAFAYYTGFRIDGAERLAYIETGITYPNLSDWWAVASVASPQAYILVFDWDENTLPDLSKLGWPRSPKGDQYAILHDLNSLLADETEAQAKITAFAEKAAKQLIAAIPPMSA
jgi:hypothetical protein